MSEWMNKIERKKLSVLRKLIELASDRAGIQYPLA